MRNKDLLKILMFIKHKLII